jgi:hypothetical protein
MPAGTRSAPEEVMATHCPHCNGRRLRAEPHRWYETLLMLLFLQPFRCRNCGERFFRFAGLPHGDGTLVLK